MNEDPDLAPPRVPRRLRTGDTALDEKLRAVLDHLHPTRDRDVLADILVSAAGLLGDKADRLDLKITSAALQEMREAFRAFAPYRNVPKVTIFGSARTAPHDPNYAQARLLAERMAAAEWMVVTGAGPGIMAAGLEGAGRKWSFGVNIRLPHEQGANEFILGDEKLVEMKYFFTRKLMLMKESSGFVSLPGGFGTLDETFELLTLIQTGKAQPAPIVLLDEPGGSYWKGLVRFLVEHVLPHRLVDEADLDLFTLTDDVDLAVAHLVRFRRNFHSIRWLGRELIVRMRHAPTDGELAELESRFGSLARDGSVHRAEPSAAERSDDDGLDLARLRLAYDGFQAGRLNLLIEALNSLPSLD